MQWPDVKLYLPQVFPEQSQLIHKRGSLMPLNTTSK